ncbi:hypothetical protein ACLOJK_034539 [Asimina triloba]
MTSAVDPTSVSQAPLGCFGASGRICYLSTLVALHSGGAPSPCRSSESPTPASRPAGPKTVDRSAARRLHLPSVFCPSHCVASASSGSFTCPPDLPQQAAQAAINVQHLIHHRYAIPALIVNRVASSASQSRLPSAARSPAVRRQRAPALLIVPASASGTSTVRSASPARLASQKPDSAKASLDPYNRPPAIRFVRSGQTLSSSLAAVRRPTASLQLSPSSPDLDPSTTGTGCSVGFFSFFRSEKTHLALGPDLLPVRRCPPSAARCRPSPLPVDVCPPPVVASNRRCRPQLPPIGGAPYYSAPAAYQTRYTLSIIRYSSGA